MTELARPRAILAIVVSRIGDTLLATPALRALAAAWPDAKLTCLAHPKRAEVLRHLPFLHRVGTITKTRAPLLGRLSRQPYDLAVVYGNDRPLVEYALRVARRTVAFDQGDEKLNARLFRMVELPPHQTVHAVRYRLALLAPLRIAPHGLALSYRVMPAEDRWARARLRPQLAGGSRPLIGLQVASFPTKAYRDWPIENFIELSRRIRSRHPGAHFLIFGGTLERDRTRRLHEQLRGCSTHYAGRLSLRQTAALMNQLDLYVGVDTGPTHIMGALQRPMVALYHGYSPSSLLAPLEHPCLYVVDHPRAGPDCSPDESMSAIPVDAVWARVLEALERPIAVAA
ncbi:MAG TPA: glycosyltransferase family 9 protein [Burkholderiales bacterium]|nr:glycosyltransferase family 9 protein [Burkholderiales bacterium]